MYHKLFATISSPTLTGRFVGDTKFMEREKTGDLHIVCRFTPFQQSNAYLLPMEDLRSITQLLNHHDGGTTDHIYRRLHTLVTTYQLKQLYR